MNIIIPIGGLGERFKKENYSKPKPLIKSLGQPIIDWVIESLNIDYNDNLYIVYNSLLSDFNFTDYLKFKHKDIKINFVEINFNTRGAAETVLQCLNNMGDDVLSETTLIVDSDNYYTEDIVNISKTYNDNLIFYFDDKQDNPIYSYIKLNSNIVTDIEEKNKISNNACVGSYLFKSGHLLKNNIIQIISKNIKSNKKEFYISTVYKNMINNGEKIYSHKIEGFNCLGTPKQLKTLSSNLNKSKKFRFCFDLDNTLVTYPKIHSDYTSVEPISKNIEFLKKLHKQGHEIIIYTARRMKTHKGNVSKVVSDIGKITFDTLDRFDIPYDEIYFGKPYADFYIDDLGVNAFSDLEKETGFYDIHPEPRKHNSIRLEDDKIIKTSNLIQGESYWYRNIPKNIENLFPKLIEYSDNSITIERINGIPLSSVYTNNTMNENVLIKILDNIKTIHNSVVNPPKNINIYTNYTEKLSTRVNTFDFSIFDGFGALYEKVLNTLKNYETNSEGILGVIHGDPVFSNILIDLDDRIKFIDMRGSLGEELTIYGDIFYDYAKIYQSIIGYDFILMDKNLDYNIISKYKNMYENYIVSNFGSNKLDYIKSITKSLLISLIPIHNNNKIHKYYNLIYSL